MNKYMIQNWRAGELGISFYIPSQSFLTVAVTGDKSHSMSARRAREGARRPLPQGLLATGCSCTLSGHAWPPVPLACQCYLFAASLPPHSATEQVSLKKVSTTAHPCVRAEIRH